MTEDDTFRVLSRLPFDDVWELYLTWLISKRTGRYPSKVEIDEFFRQHKWSYEEVAEVRCNNYLENRR